MDESFEERLLNVCRRSLAWAKARDYRGREKHDALNSRILSTALGWGKWTRILAIQGVMRSPVNLRPLLCVRPHRNPKGIGLFARAWLNLYRTTGERECLDEARRLLDLLLANPAPGAWAGLSWGYPYPWQDLGFFAPRDFPNRIVTYFVGRAMIHGWEVLGDRKYLDGAGKAVEFILKEPKILFEDDTMKCVSYVPVEDITMAVVDVPALCGVLCAMVGRHTGRKDLIAEGYRMTNWVVDKQTDYGAWYYTHPPSDSHITHDNYHTGEIVDALYEYGKYAGEDNFADSYRAGLHYYRENLFTREARPRWMNDRDYPHDIHGYAQGIITFTLAGELDFAGRIAKSALEDMWDEREGRFYYRKYRLRTDKYTPMRWAQGWMSYALSLLTDAMVNGKQEN